jgi:hypothetical protein
VGATPEKAVHPLVHGITCSKDYDRSSTSYSLVGAQDLENQVIPDLARRRRQQRQRNRRRCVVMCPCDFGSVRRQITLVRLVLPDERRHLLLDLARERSQKWGTAYISGPDCRKCMLSRFLDQVPACGRTRWWRCGLALVRGAVGGPECIVMGRRVASAILRGPSKSHATETLRAEIQAAVCGPDQTAKLRSLAKLRILLAA